MRAADRDGGQSLFLLRTIAATAFVGVLATAGVYVWWRWFDPILPDIKLVSVEITERVPPERGKHDRIYEVKRIIESADDADASIFAVFERAPPAEPLVVDGMPVIRDRVTYAIPAVPIRIQKGRHQRDRLWEVPASLEAGEYSYISTIRGCNPVRCRDLPFPALRVVIPERE